MQAIEHSTDTQKENRLKQLEKHFIKQSLLQCDGYYMHIRKHDKSAGIRFYFRGRYLVELVVDREDGPSQNICEFVLFSNKKDAITYLMLTEDS